MFYFGLRHEDCEDAIVSDTNMDPVEELLYTSIENAATFKRIWGAYEDVSRFLQRDHYIPVRSCCVSTEEQNISLEMVADVDGISIEWNNIAGTSHIFHHLYMLPRRSQSLKKVYPMLKKHLSLKDYNDKAIQALKDSVGTQIFYDSGWEYYLCLLPETKLAIKPVDGVTRAVTLKWMLEVREKMKHLLKESISTGSVRYTIDKNNINDVSQLFVLPQDSCFILQMFQQSIDDIAAPQGFRKVLFSFRFGEKNQERVILPIRDKRSVSRICVHIGMSIQTEEIDNTSIFWSRQGLQRIIGSRGTTSSVFSLFECCNYQSNLDNRLIDVSNELRCICKHPERVHFVQLYADLPHRYPKTRQHPVSAAILIGTGLRSHSTSLREEAAIYLSEVLSNFEKLHKARCRLEFVLSLPAVLNSVNPCDFLISNRLETLLEKHALIVPFAGEEFIECLRKVGYYLCHSLRALLEQFCGSSQSQAVWQAFQYEMAVEKLLWGGPLCYLSKQHAVNLGIGLTYPSRSLTDQMGFLCLTDKYASSSSEESSPPLSIYSKSECVQKQLKKMFGFSDYLDASNGVLGRRLVYIILQDLYDIGSVLLERFETFYSGLKRNTAGVSLKVAGVISKQQLANYIVRHPNWKFPMVSHHLIKMLQRKGRDAAAVIEQGLGETRLAFFPAVRSTDLNRNQCLFWNWKYGIWAIKDYVQGPEATLREKADVMCALIVRELEKRHLCFTSKLVGDRQSFPWVECCLAKIADRKLSEEGTLLVLCFVTCVAYLQSGLYVDYNQLWKLERVLPLSQYVLRALEIQGKFLLSHFNKFKLWRLHHSIPLMSVHKSSHTLSSSSTSEQNPKPVEHNEPDVSEDLHPRIDNEIEMDATDNLTVEPVRHLPSNVTGTWNSNELSILYHVKETTVNVKTEMELYIKYQEECLSKGVPDRSFHAFRAKMKRIV